MAIETIRSLCRDIIDTNRTDDTTETSAVADVNDPMQVFDRIAVDTTPQREKQGSGSGECAQGLCNV
jgi:hypothetical protein